MHINLQLALKYTKSPKGVRLSDVELVNLSIVLPVCSAALPPPVPPSAVSQL